MPLSPLVPISSKISRLVRSYVLFIEKIRMFRYKVILFKRATFHQQEKCKHSQSPQNENKMRWLNHHGYLHIIECKSISAKRLSAKIDIYSFTNFYPSDSLACFSLSIFSLSCILVK